MIRSNSCSGRLLGTIGCVALLIWLVILVPIQCSRALWRRHLEAPFRPHLVEYLSVGAQRKDWDSIDPGSPIAVSKVLVVDCDSEAVDESWYSLPEGLRATSPSEVGTVVKVHHVMGCNVDIVDWRTRRLIARDKQVAGNGVPSDEVEKNIVAYIAGLARK